QVFPPPTFWFPHAWRRRPLRCSSYPDAEIPPCGSLPGLPHNCLAGAEPIRGSNELRGIGNESAAPGETHGSLPPAHLAPWRSLPGQSSPPHTAAADPGSAGYRIWLLQACPVATTQYPGSKTPRENPARVAWLFQNGK